MAKSFKLSSTPFLLVAMTLLLGRQQTECSTISTDVTPTAAELTTSGFAVDTTVQQSSIAAETTVTQPPTPTDAPTTQAAVTSPPAATNAPGGADTSTAAPQQAQTSAAAPAVSPAGPTTQQPVAATSGNPPIPVTTTIISPGDVTSQSTPSTAVQPGQTPTTPPSQPAGTGTSTTIPPVPVTSPAPPGQVTSVIPPAPGTNTSVPTNQSAYTNLTTASSVTNATTTPPPLTTASAPGIVLSLSAPATAVQKEEFMLTATVTNVGSTSVTVRITLGKSEHIKVRTPTDKNPHDTPVTMIAEVSAKGNGSVNFWIVPQKIGVATLTVTAVSSLTSTSTSSVDVAVLSEGQPKQYSTSVVVNPSLGAPFTYSFDVKFPNNVVNGSVNITVTAVGDLLGQSLDGLDQLVQMPYGCGEQNMMNFAPDVYILKYLRIVKKNTSAIERLAQGYINYGYNRELEYRRSDGSFSAFGWRDHSGSTWLTAFVAKCFHEAKALGITTVSEAYIRAALSWLLERQISSGAFKEVGRVIHADMQGEATDGKPLTAYVLISLLENKDLITDVTALTKIKLATQYLENNFNQTDVASKHYVLNLFCYALALANSTYNQSCVDLLDQKAMPVGTGGFKHWRKAPKCPPWWYWGDCVVSVDVEMTGYGLMSYSRLGRRDAADISKWIIGQRNGRGGFTSTQDTVVALQSLAEFAAVEGTKDTQNLNISLTSGTEKFEFKTITKDNALNLQTIQMPSYATTISLNAVGLGTAVVQLNVKYSIRTGAPATRRPKRAAEIPQPIKISATQIKVDEKTIRLETCASYDAAVDNSTDESGMSILEIAMPSGYQPVDYGLLGTKVNDTVRQVEIANDTKNVILYLDELTRNAVCVNLTVNKVMLVANVQPATVSAYLYYNPGVKGIFEYTSSIDANSTWCSLCPECCACTGLSYFTCDGGQCHSAIEKCDNVQQCIDGADEQGCPAGASTLMHHSVKFTGLLVAVGNVLLTLTAFHRYLLI